MPLYARATHRLISPSFLSGRALTVHNRVNLHTQAGRGSLFGYFNQPAKPSSHFWVAFDGGVEQYVPTNVQAEADLDGNDATISIETEGLGNEPWTPQQMVALIDLVKWCMDTHGIRKVLASDSKVGDSSKGLSWHRLGIDGAFPALPDIRAGRLQRGGGMHYSSSRGKVCPGDLRIQQIPAILQGVLGAPGPVTPPVPSQPPTAPPAPSAPPFPLPSGWYFGPKSGPQESVSGYYSHREDLRRWQQRMKDRGWTITADGLYGTQTASVARAFQQEKHLIVDSKIGPQTWGAAWTAPIT